jgi:hypothetical protein
VLLVGGVLLPLHHLSQQADTQVTQLAARQVELHTMHASVQE